MDWIEYPMQARRYPPGGRSLSSFFASLRGTQPMVWIALVECGVDVFVRTEEMEAIRKNSLALTDPVIELVETYCNEIRLSLMTRRAQG
ncbi:hypothetical protein C9I57_15585 [Trinickia symbiotica]|uniref:Uncharacterized protein n=1 Tax=Trinickia symbiotica TaxID=863227 RepID=A0A2T3XTK8_9BURK|nr:hypothetical protein [Trinickia symbiotica]PTB19817.1 hypothetical protein C9I57_15585 [Trinickia symbiotica]